MSVVLRQRKLPSGNITFYLDISHNGERYRESIGAKLKKKTKSDDKKELKRIAEAIRNQREKELLTEGYEIRDFKKGETCFTTYFENIATNYTKGDKRKVSASFEKFKEHFGKIKAKQLNHNKCKGFLDYLQNHDSINSNDTIRSYFGVFRKIVHSAERDGILKKDPTKFIKVKKVYAELKKQILSIDELSKLDSAECGNENIKRAFLFCCFTGLGLKELRSLKWSSIDLNKKQLSHFSRAKTQTPLSIDLNEDALSLIGKRRNISDLVFPNLPTDTACNKTLKNWVKRAKIEKHITWYCARHSFACNLLIYGANQKTVSNLMGHVSSTMIDKYLNYVDELNKKAVNSIPSIRNKNAG